MTRSNDQSQLTVALGPATLSAHSESASNDGNLAKFSSMITSLLVKIDLHLPDSSRVVQRHLGPALRHLEPLAVPVVGNSRRGMVGQGSELRDCCTPEAKDRES